MQQPIIDCALRAHARGDKPVVAVSLMPSTDDPVFKVMTSAGIPYVRNMRNAARAVHALLNHPARRFPAHLPPPGLTTSPVGHGPGRIVLDERASMAWLGDHGLECAGQEFVPASESTAAAAERIGFPLVLKAAVTGLTHKSERGAVRVGIRDASDLAAAEAALRHEFENEDLTGFIVAEQVTGGVELLVGISTDPLLGPVVIVGAGGTEAEVLKDTALSVLPFDDERAEQMVRKLRIAPLLGPWRGRPALDVPAVVDVIRKLRAIAAEGLVAELDVNPLLVRASGAVMLDAVVSLFADHASEDRRA
jgi:acyl-CoA synthetase (NDP forming)